MSASNQAAESPSAPTPSPASPTEAEFGASHLADVPYRLEVEVGQARVTIDRLLGLQAGDVIVLDRPAHLGVVLSVEGTPLASIEVLSSEKGADIHVIEVGGVPK